MTNVGLPQEIELSAGRERGTRVALDHVLRHLPGRRLSFRTIVGDDAAFVKVFIDAGKARRHADREARRARRLEGQGLPGPRLRFQAVARVPGHAAPAPALVYELLTGGETLADVLRGQATDAGPPAAVLAVVELLARLHAAGVVQTDLHPDNFFLQGDRASVLDADGLRFGRRPVSRERAVRDVARLAVSLDAGLGIGAEHLLDPYRTARGWGSNPDDSKFLSREVHRARRDRSQRLGRKVLRSSRLTEVLLTSARQRVILSRDELRSDLRRHLEDADELRALATAPAGPLALGGEMWELRRFSADRRGRARGTAAWCGAFVLEQSGIATAAVAAMIAPRGLERSPTLVLVRPHQGETLAARLRRQPEETVALEATRRLLARLAAAGLEVADLDAHTIAVAGSQAMILDAGNLRVANPGVRRDLEDELTRLRSTVPTAAGEGVR